MSETRFRWTIYISVLAVFAVAASSPETASAARLLKAEFEVDGKVVLQSVYSDSGTEQAATVWRYIAGEPGWAEIARIQPDDADPERAHLKGNIVIRIQHVDRPIVQATASELDLVRISSPGDRWFLPDAEVERIAAANGIPQPPSFRTADGMILTALLAGLVAVTMIAGLLAWIVWPRKRVAATVSSE